MSPIIGMAMIGASWVIVVVLGVKSYKDPFVIVFWPYLLLGLVGIVLAVGGVVIANG